MKVLGGVLIGILLSWSVQMLSQIKEESPTYHMSNLTGQSMEPWLYEGMKVQVYHEAPQVGDMVSFRCKKEGCPDKNLIKFLVAQAFDCYWFEGRDGSWEKNGEKVHSLDSRTFGWVCGNEVTLNGVVHIHEARNTKSQVLLSKRNLQSSPLRPLREETDSAAACLLRGTETQEKKT